MDRSDDQVTRGRRALWLRRLLRWAGVVVLAALAALLLRLFVVEPFRIPTASMAETLHVGDYVLVSKLHYGPRLPLTLGVPFTEYYAKGVDLPYARVPGLSRVKRGDVIVFNHPSERGPIDRRTHYIKRVVGLPGDTLTLRDKTVFAGTALVPFPMTGRLRWDVWFDAARPLPLDRMDTLRAEIVLARGALPRATLEATPSLAAAVALWPEVKRVQPSSTPPALKRRVFPEGSGFTLDDYGPLYVPSKGDTLRLNASPLYETVLAHELQRAPTREVGAGWERQPVVLSQDYYFVLGDSRDNSEDSRSWGFVPESHVVGKAVLIYFSWDDRERRLRGRRIFRRVR